MSDECRTPLCRLKVEGNRSRGTQRQFCDDRCRLIHWILKRLKNAIANGGGDDLYHLKSEAAEAAFQIGVLAGAMFAGCSDREIDKLERGLVHATVSDGGIMRQKVADLFDKLQARQDGILAVPAQTRRPLTNAWKEEVLEDLVQTLEGISKPEALCFLHGQIKIARNFIQMRLKEPGAR